MEEKKKQICLRLSETEKEIIEAKAKNEKMTVNAFILKRLLDDSAGIENDINKLSSEIESLKSKIETLETQNTELRKLGLEESKSYNEGLKRMEGIILVLNETIKEKQILIEAQETKKGFWSRLFKR